MNVVLSKENIVLNAKFSTKDEAIRSAGQLLIDGGYVEASYIDSMFEREEMATTFMGNFVAIPHGTDEAKSIVLSSGISVIQVPNGVDFGNGNIVKLLFGIAGKDGGHLEILSQIAIVLSEMENVEKLIAATSAEEILSIIGEVN